MCLARLNMEISAATASNGMKPSANYKELDFAVQMIRQTHRFRENDDGWHAVDKLVELGQVGGGSERILPVPEVVRQQQAAAEESIRACSDRAVCYLMHRHCVGVSLSGFFALSTCSPKWFVKSQCALIKKT